MSFRSFRRSWITSVSALSLVGLLAACSGGGGGSSGGSDGGGGGGGAGDTGTASTMTLGSYSWDSGSSHMDFVRRLTDYPTKFNLAVANFASTSSTNIVFMNPPDDLLVPATYTAVNDSVPDDGEASVTVTITESNSNQFSCTSTGGTVTIANVGAVGAQVTGTLSITGWQVSNGTPTVETCPTTNTSGAFAISRMADYTYGNNGEADTLTVARTGGTTAFSTASSTYTENSTTLGAPLIYASYNAGTNRTIITALTDPTSTSGARGLERQFTISIPGEAPAGTYNFAVSPNSGQAYFSEGHTQASCIASGGSITVSASGGVGGDIVANFTVGGVSTASGTGCPTSYGSSSFTIKREVND